MQLELTARKTAHAVVRWRRQQLLEAGFGRMVANRLARDQRYDLHALIELIEQGCSHELAVRILAPLDGSAA